MTESPKRLLAAIATAAGLLAGGFDARLAPQSDGWWHGFFGSPSPLRAAVALLAGWAVFRMGKTLNVAPLTAMALGLLPFVPAITGSGSFLLFFSGFTMVLVLAILLGSISPQFVPRLPTLGPVSLTLVAFVFFVFVGRFVPGPAGPQGDEPHYLLIAESLLEDGDVDLNNQFEERAYSRFTSANLEPHTAPRSPKGSLYALHTPGLPVLVAPGYALGGFAGARAVVCGVMALVAGLLYFVSAAMFGSPTAAFVFVLATFASPLAIYANSLYPDSVAPLPVMFTFAYLASGRPALFVSASLAIAAMPWLHPRFLPLALVLALALSMRERPSPGRATAAFMPLFASLGLLLWHFQTLFGSFSLSAAYGPGFSSDVSLARIPWGALALLLDRQFGLLLFSPVLLLGLAGAWILWQRDRRVALLAGAVVCIQIGVGGAFAMWWGGASPPARFLIGATPALLLLCAACWQGAAANPDRHRLLGAASGFGAGLLVLACLAPRALHNRSDGGSGLLRLLAPALDLDRFFPGFVTSDHLWLAGVWVMILMGAAFRPRAGLGTGILPVLLSTLIASTPLLDPFVSSLRVLESWSNQRRAFGGEDARTAFSLNVPLGADSWNLTPGAQEYSPRFSLPKGSWTLRVDSRPEGSPGALNLARVSLRGIDDQAPALVSAAIRAGEPLTVVDFNLEASQQRVHALGEGLQARATVLSIRLTPRTPAR